MRSDLTFRSPLESDVEAIAALEAKCFEFPWKAEFFASELDAFGRYNRVLETPDGTLVGFLFTMHYLDEMHVNKIAVDPEWRRFGLGTALMDECLAFAEANGITSITLEVRESNVAARGLYRTLGFVEAYHRPRYYPDGEAAVVMERR
jgi:[ribosomal protein S18]-alanine N-acetyltransferase